MASKPAIYFDYHPKRILPDSPPVLRAARPKAHTCCNRHRTTTRALSSPVQPRLPSCRPGVPPSRFRSPPVTGLWNAVEFGQSNLERMQRVRLGMAYRLSGELFVEPGEESER